MTTDTATARHAVLHALRIKGLAGDDVLVALTGLDSHVIAATVATLADDGLAIERNAGAMSGTMITPAGRAEYDRLAAEVTLDADSRAAIDRLHHDFGPINTDFKMVCSAWQIREDGTPNDHSDPEYDGTVIARLGEVHGRVQTVLDTASASITRLGRYPDRLATALEKVRAGDSAAFARPMYDSYHDIWMELHQDLLLTAGRERGAGDE